MVPGYVDRLEESVIAITDSRWKGFPLVENLVTRKWKLLH
jgi:hypothetical protein